MTNHQLTLADLAALNFVPPHHPGLNDRALELSPGELNSDIIQALGARMLAIALGETLEATGMRLVGLAAPQLGVNKRVILVDTSYAGTDPRHAGAALNIFINPRIVQRSETTDLRHESCYSTSNVHGLVERASQITIAALDLEGHDILSDFEGFVARVFQHEIDHLDGIRFPDRITTDSHLHWVETKDDRAAYRERAEHWTCLCPRERWAAIKAGKERNTSNESA